MNVRLDGKRALVCGSSQGIGKAVAVELAQSGAAVILLARNEAALKKVVTELKAVSDQNHGYLVADFAQVAAVRKTIEQFVAGNPPVHILVNNTGGPPSGPIFEASAEEFVQAFSNHLVCNQVLAQTVVPGMKAEKYGRIINIISTSVKQPIKGLGVSNTVRGAVANWSKTLAGELAPFGITVNNVLPGATKTTRLSALIETKAAKSGKTREEVSSEMISAIPAGRFAEASEIASAVAFLASPAAAYINGINLPVDGGRTLCL
ncbi:MAG: SDR family oxidoreductase [bacterium]